MTPIRQQQLWLAKLLELEDEAAGTTTPGRRRSHSGNRSRSGSASTTMWAGVRKSLTRANTSLPRVHVDCKFESTPKDFHEVLTWSEPLATDGGERDDLPRVSIDSVEWDADYWEKEVRKLLAVPDAQRSLWAKFYLVRTVVGVSGGKRRRTRPKFARAPTDVWAAL